MLPLNLHARKTSITQIKKRFLHVAFPLIYFIKSSTELGDKSSTTQADGRSRGGEPREIVCGSASEYFNDAPERH
jgi:hypothetical protein